MLAAHLTPLTVFIGIFFLVPFITLFLYSFGRTSAFDLTFGFNLEPWSVALTDPFFRRLLLRSITIGFFVALCCVVLAYPFAYAITIGPLRRHGEFFLFAVLISLFTAYVVRIYAWRTLLGTNGVLNQALSFLGLGTFDLLLFSRFAVALTLVNVLLPLAILPIYASLSQVDGALLEAAHDAGAGPIRTLWKVTLPLTLRGVHAAFALCLLIATGDYVTPQLVGGPDGQLLGNFIQTQFGVAFNWPMGSALAFMLVASMAVVIGLWIIGVRLTGLRGRPS